MSYTVISDATTRWHRYFAFALCCTFISGFLAGVFLVTTNQSLYIPLIHGAAGAVPKVIGTFAQIAVLFSFTALVSKAGKGYLFLILCLIQAFTFGIASTAVYFTYGSAHWLIQSLLLFTRTVTLISLFWFWLQDISWRSHNFRLGFLFALSSSVLTGVLDLCLVSPIMLRLFG